VTADVTMKGRYAAVANKQPSQLQASGTVNVSDLQYKADGAPPAIVHAMQLTFTPATATLNTLQASMGKSQITATGSLDNLPAYYFKNEMLRGQLTVNSPMLDLNELRTAVPASPGAPASSSTPGAIALPANVDLSAQATIAKVLYDDITLQDVKGGVTLKDQ